jgi:hypothetical protein
MLGFPFGDSHETFPHLESMPRRRRHPGRHAHALGLRRGDDSGMDVGINGYGELWGRVTTRHRSNYTTVVGGSTISRTVDRRASRQSRHPAYAMASSLVIHLFHNGNCALPPAHEGVAIVKKIIIGHNLVL